MYGWALALGIVALIAAILGFGGIAGALANVAIILFVIALIGTAIFLFLGYRAGRNIID